MLAMITSSMLCILIYGSSTVPGTSSLDAKYVPCNLEEIKNEVVGDLNVERSTGGRMQDWLQV